ncbi:hypothetical protein [Kitasatospora sp. NPDC059571]|uniref:hypothetical protein n=1 Tax=Kitasatospora sp. NPDC059571 TaxID=3346871 RepID=UPI0036C1984E
MTTEGEQTQPPAGRTTASSADRRRRGPGRRRTALWCALVVAAAGAGWVVSRPNPGDLIPGLGPTSGQSKKAQPAPGLASEQPLTEAQAFAADHYFPASAGIDLNGFQARRTAARGGSDCTETLVDAAHDPLHGIGCQAYLSIGFTRADLQVVSSVTVLRFADAQSALKARQALADPSVLAFLTAETASPSALASSAPASASGAPSGSATPPGQPVAKPATAVRVDPVGHYLTVTVSRYADRRPAAPAGDTALADATRAVSYTARAPFLWM